MVKTKDLTNQMFGRWKVLYQVEDHITPKGAHQPMWMCECQCENRTRKVISGYSLKSKNSQSCGCYKVEVTKKNNSRHNTYELIDDKYYIGYTQSGEIFYFDKEDYDLVKQYCWGVDSQNGYLKTIDKVNNTGKLYLHRLVMGCKKGDGIIIDHINRNRIDCRKSNLRTVNTVQSAINKSIKINNTSGKVGVSWSKDFNKWESYITVNKKRKHLGLFDNFEEAERVRIEAEEKYFGEYNPIY